MEYEDFELQIGPRTGEGLYLHVLRSPAGEGGAISLLPDIAPSLPDRSSSPADAGDRLFRVLFTGRVGQLFYQSISQVRREAPARGLRVRLRINPRDSSLAPLQRVPWELLYREETDDFLALSQLTPVVRSLDVPRSSVPGPVRLPLRILVVVSQDPARGDLRLADEVQQLGEVLERHAEVHLECLATPDTRALRRTLARAPVHVLHYMGHGGFDPERGEGALLFHDSQNRRRVVSGRHLATKVKDFGSLRLVVLNACETAAAGAEPGQSPFAGAATALVLGGVPAVVAMQAPISNSHALAFSAAFYERIAAGLPVDEAMAEGRQAIHSLNPESTAWAIPVLFLRAASGDPFGAREPAIASPLEKGPAPAKSVGIGRLTAFALFLLLLTATMVERLPDERLAPAAAPAPVDRSPAPPPAPPAAASRHGEAPAKLLAIGSLRFEIAGGDALRPSLGSALRHAVPSSTASALAGWTVRLDLSAPRMTSHVEEGLPWNACRLAANCRLTGRGTSIDLGTASGVRSNVDGAAACDAAVSALAEAVHQKLAQHLKETAT